MKFALVNGQREVARPNLSGKCPVCGHSMVAKCGEVRIWHWAHKGKRQCDAWWENETEWHRHWKDRFPVQWQEVVHTGEDGEKHIADVKTDEGWVIEFQHSYLNPEERRSRDNFYPKLVWVVDGTRRTNDRKQFSKVLKEGKRVGDSPVVHIHWWEECRLLREWSDSNKHIFFDFGGGGLYWLFFKMGNRKVYVAPLYNTGFIESHSEGNFRELVKHLQGFVKNYLRAQSLKQIRQQPSQGQPDPLLRLKKSFVRRGRRRWPL